LAAAEIEDDGRALAPQLETAATGLNHARFAAHRNLTGEEAAGVYAAVAMRSVATAEGKIGFSLRRWEALKAQALESLAA